MFVFFPIYPDSHITNTIKTDHANAKRQLDNMALEFIPRTERDFSSLGFNLHFIVVSEIEIKWMIFAERITSTYFVSKMNRYLTDWRVNFCHRINLHAI